MKPVAPGFWQFRFLWPNAFNAYFIEAGAERVIVDASTRWDRGNMRRQLAGKDSTLLVLTHAHPDHQGCAKCLCEEFNIPLAVHEAEVASAEGRAPLCRQSRSIEFLGGLIWAGPRSPVGRVLREGDVVAGFTVYHMPGHTPGHIVLFRESDRLAIVGDVLNNNHLITHTQYLREPPHVYTWDVAQNRQSIRRLASLRPRLMCFGHGPVLRDMTKLERYVERL